MDSAAARCESSAPRTYESNMAGFNSVVRPPLPRLPPYQQPDSENKTPLSTTIYVASTHSTTHDSTIVCGKPLRPSAEDGNGILGPTHPWATIPNQLPGMHTVEPSEEGSSVERQLITPPPSSKSAHCRGIKPRGITTRKQAASCKQIRQRGFSDEEKAILNSLPESMRHFTEKEMSWSKAAADTDFMLTRPRRNHLYVDAKQRLTFNDLRFTAPVNKQSDTSCLIAAGIPSNKPYAPYPLPDCTMPTGLALSRDDCFREIANDATQEEAFHARPSVKLIIPDVIKALLVDDWENVTKNTQLVPLPHPKPVTKILEDYSAYEMPKRPADSSHADILVETLGGLKEYFDKSLGRILLYKFERLQYAELHKKWNSTDPEFEGKTASDIYGAEHLCRLIVSLPELIAQTNMDQQSVNRLREELAKFCTWLSKNAAEYFTSSYETPAQDYVEKAKA